MGLSEGRARAIRSALAPLLDAGAISDAEHDVLGTALALYPHGFIIDAERVEERATVDGLVERGKLQAVEGVDGGYMLAEALALDLVGQPSLN